MKFFEKGAEAHVRKKVCPAPCSFPVGGSRSFTNSQLLSQKTDTEMLPHGPSWHRRTVTQRWSIMITDWSAVLFVYLIVFPPTDKRGKAKVCPKLDGRWKCKECSRAKPLIYNGLIQ
jgi:hypothetical protein